MKLPKHEISLSITREALCETHHSKDFNIDHNDHLASYQTVEEELKRRQLNWANDEQRARAISTNELWTMYWYPDTPVGSYAIAAPTLKELLEFGETFAGGRTIEVETPETKDAQVMQRMRSLSDDRERFIHTHMPEAMIHFGIDIEKALASGDPGNLLALAFQIGEAFGRASELAKVAP